jgi:MHS family proline/betaine transporter-like MFS transporter
MLEWYDFVVYASFALQISRAFFSGRSEFTSLLATFITFGVGFFARPVGALLFGNYADRAGRRASLSVTVLLMALGTLIIAICPTTAEIGITAPMFLVFARLIQGLSAGGEIGGALAFLVECAPASRRAFYASFQELAQGGALVLCGLFTAIVTSYFSSSQVNEWAWRIPFLFGMVIAPVGFYIRRHVAESELFLGETRRAALNTSWRTIWTEHWKPLLVGMGLIVIANVTMYVLLYMPTFAHVVLKIPQSDGGFSLIIVGVVIMTCPLAGILADRFSRKAVMLCASVCLAIYPYPAFCYLTSHATTGSLVAVQTGLAVPLAVYAGPVSALLPELFPTNVRSTGAGLSYSLAVTIFGGFTPAIISALVHYTGSELAVAYWLIASAAISTVSLCAVQDRGHQELV